MLSWREHIEVYNRNMMHALEEVVGNTSEPITILVPPAGNETVSCFPSTLVVYQNFRNFWRRTV